MGGRCALYWRPPSQEEGTKTTERAAQTACSSFHSEVNTVPIRWDPFHVVVVVVDVVVDALVVGSAQTSGPTKNGSRRLTTAEKRLHRLVSRLVRRFAAARL